MITQVETTMTPDERKEQRRRENLAASRTLVLFLLVALAGGLGIGFAIIKIIGEMR